MNERAQKLLMNWIILVMQILLESNLVPHTNRIRLAELTAQLQAAMDEGRPRKPERRGK